MVLNAAWQPYWASLVCSVPYLLENYSTSSLSENLPDLHPAFSLTKETGKYHSPQLPATISTYSAFPPVALLLPEKLILIVHQTLWYNSRTALHLIFLLFNSHFLRTTPTNLQDYYLFFFILNSNNKYLLNVPFFFCSPLQKTLQRIIHNIPKSSGWISVFVLFDRLATCGPIPCYLLLASCMPPSLSFSFTSRAASQSPQLLPLIFYLFM